MKDFDIIKTPLQGTHLVEANAGTGKTYALAGLFLRLILEQGLSPGEILVVTYTRAATQELQDRIRRMIRDAVDFVSRGTPADPFLECLMKGQQDRDRSLYVLTRALRDLDEASIFTIHAFCQRLLQENAFETGSLFDVELITEEQSLQQEIVEDFWRKHICTAEPEFVHYLFNKKWSPERLLKTLGPGLKHPRIRVIPKPALPSMDTLADYRKSLHTLKQMWRESRNEVLALLMDPGIKGNSYGVTTSRSGLPSARELKVHAMVAAMDQFLNSQNPLFPPFSDLEKFTTSKLADSMKKGCIPPEHRLFDLCDRLLEQKDALIEEMDQYMISLKGRLFQYAMAERSRRKDRLNVRAYDDLLTDTLSALEDGKKESFIRAARLKYRAALIDEFQDTDPVQYRIFSTLFGTGKTPLFFIGDPKQAIYGFRGADVVTYLKAADSVSDSYTLRKNWRSEPGLVRAVNTLFSGIESPFVYQEIAYTPSEATETDAPLELRVEGDQSAPLRIWLVHPPEGEETSGPLAKKRVWPMILGSVAAEIARLIHLGKSRKAFIGDESLSERHMAVLVRKNREARWIQDALGEFKIPSVLYNAGDLFETREALEVGRILQAIAQPDNEGQIKAALATDVIGMHGETLESLSEQEDAWEQRIFDFKEYHRIWEDQGFIPMFRRLIAREKVRSRLLAFPDGERRLTNLLHLGEVLHRTALEQKLGLSALSKWLFCQMEDRSPGAEEHLLRLESDEEAVKIVTVHKSKGLEYPVVFCPSLWDGGMGMEKEVIYHDPDEDLKLTMDLGSDERESHEAIAREELLAENLRLLYVALTRAKQRCYVVWGRIKDAETSALAYVLHSRNMSDGDGAVQRTRKAFQSLTRNRIVDDLARLEQASGGTIDVEPLPTVQGPIPSRTPEETSEIESRIFSARIPKDWKISSFSSLSSGEKLDVNIPDYNDLSPVERSVEAEIEERPREPASGIFAFPKGARAGTCLHDILEHLDFTKKGKDGTRNLITKKLGAYGFENKWVDTIEEMVQKVLSTPLDPRDTALRLQEIGLTDRLNELEFSFPLKKIAPDVLKKLFSDNGAPELPDDLPETMKRLHFSPVRGFIKGFMDLVFFWKGRFYLVDWKSNHLGDRIEDYGPDGLKEAMKEGNYYLQYHLYTLALDQYLRLRLPGYRYENAFGGVYYIFLRGVDPEMGPYFGIFRHRPAIELIAEMREALIE